MASMMEQHHQVTVLDEALEEAVKLSHRYIPARQLPDKAVSVLDTAAARVAVSQYATPAAVEDCQRRIQALEVELTIIKREAAVGIDIGIRKTEADQQLSEQQQQLQQLEQRWQKEKTLVDDILQLRAQLRGDQNKVEGTDSSLEQSLDEAADSSYLNREDVNHNDDQADSNKELLEQLKQQQVTLTELQHESPLILPSVDGQAIASVIADWTGIPVGRMIRDEIAAVLNLSETLNQRVVGQKHALKMIAKRVQTSRAGLDSPNKPIGVFLLCGPSGVGKNRNRLSFSRITLWR